MARSARYLFALAIALVPLALPSAAQAASTAQVAASLVGDVARADGALYQATTSNGGVSLDALKVIQGPVPGTYVGVFHVAQPSGGLFSVRLALSDNLRSWAGGPVLSWRASMPTIAAVPGGGYLVAFELADARGRSQIALEYFRSFSDLLVAKPARVVDLHRGLSATNEGTPSFHSIKLGSGIAHSRVVLGLHYNSGDGVDRNGVGVLTDFSRWSERPNAALNRALEADGVRGSIGARTGLRLDDTRVQLIEGQTVPDSWNTWRIYAYEPANHVVSKVMLATPYGSSFSVGVPRASTVRSASGQSLLVLSAFVYQQGSPQKLDGELVWWIAAPG